MTNTTRAIYPESSLGKKRNSITIIGGAKTRYASYPPKIPSIIREMKYFVDICGERSTSVTAVAFSIPDSSKF